MEIDVEYEAEQVVRRVDRVAEEARERVERLGPVVGRATSGDGSVSVVVRPGGLLSEVKLTAAALDAGADALAAQVMAVAERATRRAGANMHRTLAPVLGPEGEKHLSSLGYEPAPEDPADTPENAVFDAPLGARPPKRGSR
ncbi:YbaB/EbfC family nucleoid-associated protein [Actinokineospora enzanensis]|uniref:YbaB/EbfC family nucleoid-associated protein n=1 Tax=Actinokineospora enzanensis TaxID=155975 RepID=UPI000376E671|nr:YbaB/EbfC family nucleoid-associated protein [Actinokineospora enzanensis]